MRLRPKGFATGVMRSFLLASGAVPLALLAGPAAAQVLQDRAVPPPTTPQAPAPAPEDDVRLPADPFH